MNLLKTYEDGHSHALVSHELRREGHVPVVFERAHAVGGT
jgi:cation diffusion facilitator CzcD-associated flavoprotein CzcO